MMPYVQDAMCTAGEPDLHSVELFSGKAANTKGVSAQGLKAIGYDKTYSNNQDILTNTGFRWAIDLILRVKQGGAVWAAPKCSSWIFMCTSQSKRTNENPAGDKSVSWVREGNEIAKRTIALLMLAASLGAFIYMEQPCSSYMVKAEPGRSFTRTFARHSVTTSLGAFGAETQKNIKVWSNDPACRRLKRNKCGHHMATLTHRSAGGSITGNKETMTASQAYPKEFGITYGKLVASNYHSSLLKKTFTHVF